MARMIRAFCPNNAATGEKAVYAAMQAGGHTREWIVLHSPAIADQVRQVEREAGVVAIAASSAGQDESPILAAAIRGLKDERYELSEMVVLSALRDNSTAEDSCPREILTPADGFPGRPGHLQYSSIHAFNAFDSPAVIVTDLVANCFARFSFSTLGRPELITD